MLVQAVVLPGMKHMIFAADAEDMETAEHDLIANKQALGLEVNDRESTTRRDPTEKAGSAVGARPRP